MAVCHRVFLLAWRRDGPCHRGGPQATRSDAWPPKHHLTNILTPTERKPVQRRGAGWRRRDSTTDPSSGDGGREGLNPHYATCREGTRNGGLALSSGVRGPQAGSGKAGPEGKEVALCFVLN